MPSTGAYSEVSTTPPPAASKMEVENHWLPRSAPKAAVSTTHSLAVGFSRGTTKGSSSRKREDLTKSLRESEGPHAASRLAYDASSAATAAVLKSSLRLVSLRLGGFVAITPTPHRMLSHSSVAGRPQNYEVSRFHNRLRINQQKLFIEESDGTLDGEATSRYARFQRKCLYAP